MVSPATLTQAQPLREWAESVMREWQLGQAPDTSACLRQRPDLAGAKSVLVELAYEEYRLRRQRGEALDAQAYCAQFSKCRYELRRMLSVHRALIEENPSWLATFEAGFGGDFDGDFGNVDAWPALGEEWLGYQIIEELGRGGLARVYLAAETEAAGRHVVLKVSARETDEAQHLAPLSHANIMPVLTVRRDEHSGMSAIVMPFLGRTTLYDVLDATYGANEPPATGQVFSQVASKRLQAGDMPQFATIPDARFESRRGPRHDSYVESLIRLGMELADALAHTHGRGVLHRDLKPSNVLITPSGRPLLMDFNLSTANDESALWGGTIPYMPSELLLVVAGSDAAEYEHDVYTEDAERSSIRTTSSPRRPAGGCDLSTVRAHRTHPDPAHDHPSRANWQATADVRSDLFSLGAILYELYTGDLPYGQPDLKLPVESQSQAMIRRQAQRIVRFPANSSRLAKRFERILKSCLSPDPEARPKNARQLADQLAALLPERRTWRAKAVVLASLICLTIVMAFSNLRVGAERMIDTNTATINSTPDTNEKPQPTFSTFNDIITLAESDSEEDRVLIRRGLEDWLATVRKADTQSPTRRGSLTSIRPKSEEVYIQSNTREFLTATNVGTAWAWLAYYCNLEGAHPAAHYASTQAIRNGVNDAAVYNNKSYALRCMEGLGEAISDASTAIELSPQSPAPYLNRAIALVATTKTSVPSKQESLINEAQVRAIRKALVDCQYASERGGDSIIVLKTVRIVETHAKNYLDSDLVDRLREPFLDEIDERMLTASVLCEDDEYRFNLVARSVNSSRNGTGSTAYNLLMRPTCRRDNRTLTSEK